MLHQSYRQVSYRLPGRYYQQAAVFQLGEVSVLVGVVVEMMGLIQLCFNLLLHCKFTVVYQVMSYNQEVVTE